eukprot:2976359-Pleurochrysis_carterae.AAC.4
MDVTMKFSFYGVSTCDATSILVALTVKPQASWPTAQASEHEPYSLKTNQGAEMCAETRGERQRFSSVPALASTSTNRGDFDGSGQKKPHPDY